MAISAVAVTTTDTLETFRVEFNNLVADVASIEQVGASNIIISDGGNIGSASDTDSMSIAADGTVTYTQPVNFAGGLVVSNLDIDGATDISAAIVDADLFIVDDGASGTNRKTAASRIKTYIADVTLTTAAQTAITSVGTLTALDVDNININGNTISASSGAVNITPAGGSAIVLDGTVNIDAGVVTGITSLTSNAILIADAGTIGSASSTSAITIASTGIVTFVDDILIKDGGTIGSASSTSAITIASTGVVTFVDDIIIKDAGTIGSASDTDAISIASDGVVTFSQAISGTSADFDGGVTIDNITIDGTEIDLSSGDLTLDVAGDIILNAGGGEIFLEDDGTQVAEINLSTSDLRFETKVSNADIRFQGSDGGFAITALQLDMSASGMAIFNSAITTPSYLWMKTDGITGLYFGANAEISVVHVHDTGLTFKNTISGTDNRPFVLQLKSEEDAIVADDVIASIELAAGDSDGTDGATVAAGIHAIAEGTFSASANATKLVFTTGVSETAASSATAKMTLSSAGLLTIADDFVIKDGGTIGSTTTPGAITVASNGAVTTSTNLNIGGQIIGQSHLQLDVDYAQIFLGEDQDVTITHYPDSGFTVSNTATGDNKPITITLENKEDDISVDETIGQIHFRAAGEDSGTDAVLIAATIAAVSEGDFSASNNATKLSFRTAASEIATEKMSLSSTGLLTIADDFMIKDGGTIGVASTNDAITISSAGIVTFKDDIIIKDGGTIGSASATDAITIASSGDVTLTGASANVVFDKSDNALEFADNAKAVFGAGDDLKIYHDGTDNYIQTNGGGPLRLHDSTAGDMIRAESTGVRLYHGGATKLTTTSAGASITGELLTTGFSSSDFAAAFIVIEDGGTDGSGGNAGDNLIDETDSDDLLMENVTSWVTSGFTIRDSFGNHLQTVNGVS